MDRFCWLVLDRVCSVKDRPFQIKKGLCGALIPRKRRSEITIKFFERHAPVHVEPDIVAMLPNWKFLTVPDSLSSGTGKLGAGVQWSDIAVAFATA